MPSSARFLNLLSILCPDREVLAQPCPLGVPASGRTDTEMEQLPCDEIEREEEHLSGGVPRGSLFFPFTLPHQSPGLS